MAEVLGGIAMPAEVLARLAPPNPRWLMQALTRHFVAVIVQGEGARSPSILLNRRLWLVAVRPQWSGLGNVPRHDRGRDWDRAYGRESHETLPQRVSRHALNYRHWAAFVSRTILGR